MDTPDGYAPTHRGTSAARGGEALSVSQNLLFASFYPLTLYAAAFRQ